MDFKPYHILFPVLMEHETRSVSISGDSNIPDGDYVFLEVYCADKTCDCRRVFIQIHQVNPVFKPFHAATISYGWEPLSFYKKWGGGIFDDMLKEMKGPALDKMNIQSPYAPFFLGFFINMIEHDKNYNARLRRHYFQLKWKTGMNIPRDVIFDPTQPCPCKSGAKFKYCCGKRGQ